jgi:ribose 5-phosphate isomerase B
MIFIVASDHTDRVNRISKAIRKFLEFHGHKCLIYNKDCSPDDDFPLIAKGAVEKVCAGECDRAVLIGGTASGMAMVANKFKGIRAAAVEDAEQVKLVAERDDPNIICISAWRTDPGMAVHMVRTWLNTKPSSNPKYKRRMKDIQAREEQNFK